MMTQFDLIQIRLGELPLFPLNADVSAVVIDHRCAGSFSAEINLKHMFFIEISFGIYGNAVERTALRCKVRRTRAVAVFIDKSHRAADIAVQAFDLIDHPGFFAAVRVITGTNRIQYAGLRRTFAGFGVTDAVIGADEEILIVDIASRPVKTAGMSQRPYFFTGLGIEADIIGFSRRRAPITGIDIAVMVGYGAVGLAFFSVLIEPVAFHRLKIHGLQLPVGQ